jgi:predicted nucleic acid-binding protein
MKVLVDTSVWSVALRRRSSAERSALSAELASLVQDSRVVMIGPVRQEILSGIKQRAQFDRLRDVLRAFPDVEITTHDYEEAASLFNRCREKGIQGSNTDFLLCAVAVRHEFSIFTTDDDFKHFGRVLPVSLHQLGV